MKMKSKEQKRQEALARKEVYDKMSPFQKLSRLDGLFGCERGARKERRRLTHGLCRYIANLPKAETMAPVHTPPEVTPELVEQKQAEEKAKEEARVGMNTPLTIPKPRVRLVIPTEGREQVAR